jgi:hypothetical protein
MKTFTMLTIAGTLACAAPALADSPLSTTTTTPSAAQLCHSEKAQMGAATFAQTYGTNANRANAFGKCVSKRAQQSADAATAAKTSASAACKAEQTADPAAFAKKYGTGKKGANAFGKCVSGQAKTRKAAAVKADTDANVNAAKTCKAARKADPAAFTAKWGKARNAFGKCVSSTAKAAAQS